MNVFLQILVAIVALVVGVYLFIDRCIPVEYGILKKQAYYDGLITSEDLKLYNNGVFLYSDGWHKWNGEYKICNDTLLLDYFFPTNKPTVYLFEKGRLNAYRIKKGEKVLVHDLKVIEGN